MLLYICTCTDVHTLLTGDEYFKLEERSELEDGETIELLVYIL